MEHRVFGGEPHVVVSRGSRRVLACAHDEELAFQCGRLDLPAHSVHVFVLVNDQDEIDNLGHSELVTSTAVVHEVEHIPRPPEAAVDGNGAVDNARLPVAVLVRHASQAGLNRRDLREGVLHIRIEVTYLYTYHVDVYNYVTIVTHMYTFYTYVYIYVCVVT